MPTEKLPSNLLNYLIWRYLQESGFGKAAIELSKAWNRDPESLPFASRVRKYHLINIVQDGLQLDYLNHEANGAVRAYDFGTDFGPEHSIQSGDPENELPYGTTLHPPHAHSANGQLQHARDTETSVPPDITTRRATARRRKGTVSKEHRPIEVMDMDTNGLSHHLSIAATEGAISDAPSPAVDEPPQPPPTTVDIGESKVTQSERVQQLIPEAAIVKVQPPQSHTPSTFAMQVEHARFAPSEPKALLLAGNNLARVYIIPTNMNSSTVPLYLDISGLAPTFHVLACAWVPPLDGAVLAVWEVFENEKGDKLGQGRIVHMSKGVTSAEPVTRTLAKQIRDVVALRWNQSSRSLLCVSFTETAGMIRVWTDGLDQSLPLFKTKQQLFDAQWVSDSQFVVCGKEVVTIYEVVATPEGARVKLVDQRVHNNIVFHRLSYDPITSMVAAISLDTPDLILLESPSGFKPLNGQEPDPDSDRLLHHYVAFNAPTALSFQPIPNPASLAADAPRLLATAMDSGEIIVFNTRQQWKQVTRLALGEGMCAEVCAWSGDGFLLAAAGGGRVTVWRAEDILAESSTRRDVLPRAVWTAPEGTWKKKQAKPQPWLKWFSPNGTGAVQEPAPGTGVGDATDKGKGKEKEANGEAVANGLDHGSAMEIDGQEKQNDAETTSTPRSESGAGDEDMPQLIWDEDGKKLIYTASDQVAVINLRWMSIGPTRDPYQGWRTTVKDVSSYEAQDTEDEVQVLASRPRGQRAGPGRPRGRASKRGRGRGRGPGRPRKARL
ncbi:hypothetical protein NA57DRAFT_58416 [Rhizodiscina lignyota]|uniref:LisH domain-containing protein n=1 Tax=Rhizodiscina lignyota TaxID=1504668 RepID=A0A9P4M481_9PEZI|nr:hypothetical protein NA57DRAFT_58416 [Rhizodiscina lignyota]